YSHSCSCLSHAFIFFQSSGVHRDLHSFPTRRSSDLEMFQKAYAGGYAIGAFNVNNMEIIQGITEAAQEVNSPLILQVSAGARKRSEEHTSELQSRFDLVCRLLLEKKNPLVYAASHQE